MIYVFKHPSKEKFIELHQRINDVHEYRDEKGVKWDRVFTAPQVSIDANIDPFSPESFVEKTGRNKGTIGDLMDRSAELSEKRASRNGGVDPLRVEAFDKYAKKRRGLKHPDDPRRYAGLEKMGVKVDRTKNEKTS